MAQKPSWGLGQSGFGENSQLTIQPPTLPPIQLVMEDVPLSDLRVYKPLSFRQSPSHGLRFFCLL